MDAFVGEELVIAEAVVAGIVNGGVYRKHQAVFLAALQEAIEALERKREIIFAGLSDGEVDRQVVSAGGDDLLIEGVAEVVDLAVRGPSPVGSPVGVKARAIALVVALF